MHAVQFLPLSILVIQTSLPTVSQAFIYYLTSELGFFDVRQILRFGMNNRNFVPKEILNLILN